MYLKSLRLENIACFEELDLDFTDENGEPCKWVVLLGENGTGKSTSLRMLAITSLGYPPFAPEERPFNIPFVGLKLERFIRDENHKTYSDRVTPVGRVGNKDYLLGNLASVVKISDDDRLASSNEDFECELLVWSDGFSQIGSPGQQGNVPHRSRRNVNTFMYGVSKLSPPEKWKIHSDNRVAVQRFGRLFGYSEFKDANDWLRNLYVRSIHPSANEKDIGVFDKAKNLINMLLPGIRFKEIDIDGNVLVYEGDSIVALDTLSDGYRSVSDWIFDLIHWIFEAFSDLSDPLKAEGVVLVDEIDLHLHPRWQRTIVQKIRDTFPNLQFIVTSHSPFVAQDMTEKDKIIVLTREGDKVTARQEKGFVKGWRADQILTSWLFGLETTRDEEIESLEKERRVGLQSDEENLLTDSERQQLEQVTKELEAMRSSDVAPDRQKLEGAAALVMELMSRTL